MKILLLQPPVQDFYDTPVRLQPLGLCMLKAVLKERLPEVEVIVKDYHQGFGKREIPIPPELSYLKEYYPVSDSSPFSTFHRYYHFGASFEEIASDVEQEAPDIIGISSLFSPYHREAAGCAREIRRRMDKSIIIGGSHVSSSPLSVLADPNVDFVIYGEGERSMVEFVKTFQAGGSYEEVPNLGYKKEGKLILNPPGKNYPYESLPRADFSDLPLDRYVLGKKPLCFITTSRGCPHRCSFCSVHLTFTDGFRRRSPEQVMVEMEKRYAEGYRVFDFEDDNLTFQKADFMRLLEMIIQRWPPGEIFLAAMNGISYLSLDLEILGLMKKAGFKDLNLSLVSADEAALAKVSRPHTLDKFLETVNHANSLGFRIVSYQIIGLPFENLDKMIETMALMTRLPVLIGPSIFYLTPGCPMSLEHPIQSETDYIKARSTALGSETAHFCRDDLYTLFVTARILNFLKGLDVGKTTLSLKEALVSAGKFGRRAKTGSELLMRILQEGKLYAATPQGLKTLSRFRPELFFGVLNRAGYVQTRQRGRILLKSMEKSDG